MKVLTIDMATKLGWCVVSGEVWLSGSVDLGAGKPASPLSAQHNYICGRALAFLTDLAAAHRPDAIVIELPNARGAGIRLLFGLIGVAHAVAASIGAQSTTAEVSKWRSVVLGHGGRSTEEADRRILAFARGRVPTVASDDEADAIGIAEWALQRLLSPARTPMSTLRPTRTSSRPPSTSSSPRSFTGRRTA